MAEIPLRICFQVLRKSHDVIKTAYNLASKFDAKRNDGWHSFKIMIIKKKKKKKKKKKTAGHGYHDIRFYGDALQMQLTEYLKYEEYLKRDGVIHKRYYILFRRNYKVNK